jgi:hypothetical protein
MKATVVMDWTLEITLWGGVKKYFQKFVMSERAGRLVVKDRHGEEAICLRDICSQRTYYAPEGKPS